MEWNRGGVGLNPKGSGSPVVTPERSVLRTRDATRISVMGWITCVAAFILDHLLFAPRSRPSAGIFFLLAGELFEQEQQRGETAIDATREKSWM